jgi:hypothetical protein
MPLKLATGERMWQQSDCQRVTLSRYSSGVRMTDGTRLEDFVSPRELVQNDW